MILGFNYFCPIWAFIDRSILTSNSKVYLNRQDYFKDVYNALREEGWEVELNKPMRLMMEGRRGNLKISVGILETTQEKEGGIVASMYARDTEEGDVEYEVLKLKLLEIEPAYMVNREPFIFCIPCGRN